MRTLLAVEPTLMTWIFDLGDRRVEHAANGLGDVAHVNERAPLLAPAVDRDLARHVGVLGHDVDREVEAHSLGEAEHRGEAERGHRDAGALPEREEPLLGVGLAVRVERDRMSAATLRSAGVRRRARTRCTTTRTRCGSRRRLARGARPEAPPPG